MIHGFYFVLNGNPPMNAAQIIERRLREARRRLFVQDFLDRAIFCGAIALAVGLAFVLLYPFLPIGIKSIARGWVLGALASIALLVPLIWSLRRVPSLATAALAIDRRFHLQERITTACSLSSEAIATPTGEAVLADAAAKLEPLAVRGRFPIGFKRSAVILPVQIAILIVVLLFYKPTVKNAQAGTDQAKNDGVAKVDPENGTGVSRADPPRSITIPADRINKSEELKKLEEDLKKLYADASKNPVKPEQLAQKLEQLATAEERLRKQESQQAEKFQRLQEQLQRLDSLAHGDLNREGPGKGLRDALAKGDIAKAKEEADLLKKKVKDKKLAPQDAEQLKKQAEELRDKVERLSRNQDEQKKLQDLINQAKKDNRDAESLERELKQLQEEAKQLESLKQLADKLGEIAKSLEKNDFDGVEKNLGDLAKQLERLDAMLDDLDDIDEHLQNLKQLRRQLAGKLEEMCEGCEKDDPTKAGRGSGKRPENPDATSSFEETRARARFDPKGRKTYGGAVDGPAFTKKTTLELIGDIKQAAQEAPNAIDVQRLPRAAREMVKEYFENWGGQEKK